MTVESGGNAVRLIGKAGEHLVCADLFLRGWVATLASEGQPYDVIAEQGGRMIRVAVKSTQEARPRRAGARDAYCFTINRRRPGKRLLYTRAEADVIALVTIDTKRVGYMGVDRCPQIVWIFCDHATPNERRYGPRVSCMRRFDQLGLEEAVSG
jgi:hypothetical protein